MSHDPVVVVGTTPDYVAKIYEKYPEAAFFVLDTRFEASALLDSIDKSVLLFTRLTHHGATLESVQKALADRRLSPQGIACFDCESLIVASKLAFQLGKPFPPTEAIVRTRNKFESRKIWEKAGLQSPRAIVSSGLQETLEFFRFVRKDIVLKPVSGSGSELLFHCASGTDIVKAVRILKEQLPRRKAHPLFSPIRGTSPPDSVDPCRTWIVEEYISGPEFSCDFLLENGQLTILRETGKLKAPSQPFGSVLAYTLPPSYPQGFASDTLPHILKKASTALGFTWGHFMVDFIVCEGNPVIIEMAPRPGGDSIPDLVEIATGFDLLRVHLEIVSGKFRPTALLPLPPEPFASVNLYAPRQGIIQHLDPSAILSLSWVKGLFLKKQTGDRVTLPPDDYDNRVLGYCIICPTPHRDLVSVCDYLQHLLDVSIRDAQPRDHRNGFLLKEAAG